MRTKVTIGLLLLPLITVTLGTAVACIYVLIQSFGYIPALHLTQYSIDAYQQLIQRPLFIQSIVISLRVALVSTVLSTVGGTLLCAAMVPIAHRLSTQISLRIILLLPHAIVALVIITILSQTGLLSRILYLCGFISQAQAFPQLIQTPHMEGVIVAYILKELPFVAWFTLTLMVSISRSYTEASFTLGASPLRAFVTITLPLSLPCILKAALIIFVFSFSAYELPYVLGSSTHQALPVYAYQLYSQPDLAMRPQAFAACVFMLFVAFTSALIYLICTRSIHKRMGVNAHEIME